MHRSVPKILIVCRTISPFRSTVHFRPGTPMPEILTAVFGCAAKRSIASRHRASPSSVRFEGRPV